MSFSATFSATPGLTSRAKASTPRLSQESHFSNKKNHTIFAGRNNRTFRPNNHYSHFLDTRQLFPFRQFGNRQYQVKKRPRSPRRFYEAKQATLGGVWHQKHAGNARNGLVCPLGSTETAFRNRKNTAVLEFRHSSKIHSQCTATGFSHAPKANQAHPTPRACPFRFLVIPGQRRSRLRPLF